MREATRKTICAHCRRLITKQQRPSVKMKDGKQVHAACYNAYQDAQRHKPN